MRPSEVISCLDEPCVGFLFCFCLFFGLLSKQTGVMKGFFEKDDGFPCAICVTVPVAVTAIYSLEAPPRFKHKLLLIWAFNVVRSTSVLLQP